MTDTIERLLGQLDATYSAENPPAASERYLATLASIEIARQLTRIADKLEGPEHPTLPSLSKNSLHDGVDEYREPPDAQERGDKAQREYYESLDEQLSNAAELHSCTQPGRVAGCVNCPDRDDCERETEGGD